MQPTIAPEPIPHCSFCRRDRRHVSNMVSGPGVYICDACVGLCARMFSGKATVVLGAFASLTDGELLDALPAAAFAVQTSEDQLRLHVAELRGRGVSWEKVASALGVTRQAAWERFSDES